MASCSMVDYINSLRMDRHPSEIESLNFNGCKCTEVEGLDKSYKKLRMLSFAAVGLTSLKGIPALPSLQKINLCANKLEGGLDHLVQCQNLEYINLRGNDLPSIEDIKPLANLPKLKTLILDEFKDCENFRADVFDLIKSLKTLNGLNRDGEDDSVSAGVANGNGSLLPNQDDDSCDDDYEEESEDEEDDDDEVGIEALQGSDDLGDDPEDYVPSDTEEVDEEYEDDELEEEEVGNLSGGDVKGARLGRKRKATDDSVEEPKTKCSVSEVDGPECSVGDEFDGA